MSLSRSKSQTAEWVAHRIRELRQERGLSQVQLADALGRTQATVSNWEAGRRVPGLDDLIDIAAAFDRPTYYLLPPAEPREPVAALFRSAAQRLAIGALPQVVDRVLDEAERMAVVDAAISIRSTQPAHAANELIEKAELRTPPVDVLGLAARCGVRVVSQRFPDHISGLLIVLDDGPVVGVNSSHPPVRQRFTIGHELGHHLLKHSERFYVDVTESAAPGHDYLSERAANEFAAELLMPRRMLAPAFERDSRPEGLASLFKVSQVAMGYRLVDLGLR
jgi:Zn-dependent peptidase ImmA (M78 family)/DNA-binding XRE family transcriptional regulator